MSIEELTEKQKEMEKKLKSQTKEILNLKNSLEIEYSDNDDKSMNSIIHSDLGKDKIDMNRPQLSVAGLEMNNKHFNDLSNHELHQIKKMHQEDHSEEKPKTILDENLGDIIDKTINFLTYSFDGYSKKYNEAELLENLNDKKTFYQSLKLHIIATMLFIRDDENIIYIGILFVFLSIIIYFINIIVI
tara:strand:- start:48 stop:611 length:564 start_codon:yes stop_codon:yes gene_type:complete